MRCYTGQHRFYAGVDLHARTMFTHVLDANGKTVFEEDLPTDPEVSKALALVGSSCLLEWGRGPDLEERFGAVPVRPGGRRRVNHPGAA
jgi:hypothetical protein